MKIVVTGAAGRLGQSLTTELVDHGHEVVCLDMVPLANDRARSLTIDLRETERLYEAFTGADAVIHLARKRFPYTANGYDPDSGLWKMPDFAGDAERFSHNVAITYNVLTAALHAGVKKVVSGSSLAAYGFYYPLRPLFPDYVPVEENHSLKPQDPYGISKLVGEEMCAAFARKSDMQIASLRFAGIATDDQYPILKERAKDPLCRGTGALWSYIDVRDAAISCRLAVEASFSGHEAFNICAPETMMKESTLDLVRKYLPEVKEVKPRTEPNWCGYDTGKAEKVLGFRARYLLKS